MKSRSAAMSVGRADSVVHDAGAKDNPRPRAKRCQRAQERGGVRTAGDRGENHLASARSLRLPGPCRTDSSRLPIT